MTSIKDRLAALRAQHKKTAPSFAPSTRQKKEQVVIPDVSDLVTDSHDLESLRELVALHVQYGAAERAAKHQKKPVAESIKSICVDYGLTKVVCDGNKLSYYKTVRSSINEQMLLDAGVSPTIIKACTIKTDSWQARITPPGEEEDEDV